MYFLTISYVDDSISLFRVRLLYLIIHESKALDFGGEDSYPEA